MTAVARPAKTASNTPKLAPPSPKNGNQLPLGAHPKNTGGKKGRSGRPPDWLKAQMHLAREGAVGQLNEMLVHQSGRWVTLCMETHLEAKDGKCPQHGDTECLRTFQPIGAEIEPDHLIKIVEKFGPKEDELPPGGHEVRVRWVNEIR